MWLQFDGDFLHSTRIVEHLETVFGHNKLLHLFFHLGEL